MEYLYVKWDFLEYGDEIQKSEIFYEIVQKSLKKLVQVECYPDRICSQFCTVADPPGYNSIIHQVI